MRGDKCNSEECESAGLRSSGNEARLCGEAELGLKQESRNNHDLDPEHNRTTETGQGPQVSG